MRGVSAEPAESGLEVLRRRLSRPFRVANLTVRRALGALTLVMTLAAVYHFYDPLFRGPPALPAMTGDINVAVASFVAAAGTSPAHASGLSDSLYRALRSSLPTELSRGTGLDIQLASPELVGRIGSGGGTTARALAAQLGADVVIYGVVKDLTDGIEVTPEFYFAPRDDTHPEDQQPLLTAVAVPPEPSGRQPMGSIRDVEPAWGLARAAVRHGLELRARAFAFFIVGLDYYRNALVTQRQGSTGRASFVSSERWFDAAGATHAWDPRVVNVLDVFLGNVALELQRWAFAEHEYRAALTADPGYDRAEFGLAEAQFHQAASRCGEASQPPRSLVQARNDYQQALSTQSSDVVLRAKEQFGLGRAALCLAASGAGGQYAVAQREFSAVATEYSAGDHAITTQAAEADGGLGLIALLRGDRNRARLAQAGASLEQAIALTPPSPVKRALYGFLSQVERRLGQRAAALENQRRAAVLARPRAATS